MRTALLVITLAFIPACGDSSPTTSPATAPGVTEKLKEAGREIKDVTEAGARKAEPYVEKAAEKIREGVHTGAAWVEEKSRSDIPVPATQPASQQ